MKLEFDSISELEQFLMFSAHIGRAFAAAPPAENGPIAPDALQDGTPVPDTESITCRDIPEEFCNLSEAESIAHREQQDAKNKAFVEQNVAANAEIAKRKRRTKAEMEAARAAESAPQPEDRSEASPPASANPFAVASPATQAILEAPNQSAATLAGMAAMQTPPAEEPPAAPRVIESIEHLHACQNFIKAHGMTKYNESFRDGLTANIMGYTPEQRAQHVAILETLGA